MKPDHILKEDIIRELQDIEDNLNEWEKRGVELEVKLRSSEEGEMNVLVLHEPPRESGEGGGEGKDLEEGVYLGLAACVCLCVRG